MAKSKTDFRMILSDPATKAGFLGERNEGTLALSSQGEIFKIISNLGGTFFILGIVIKFDGTVVNFGRNLIQIEDTQTADPVFQSYIPLHVFGNPDNAAIERPALMLRIPRLLRTGQSLKVNLNTEFVAMITNSQVSVGLEGVYTDQAWNKEQILFS